MYVWFAQLGVGHDVQNPTSSRRQSHEPADDIDVEDQCMWNNYDASSSEAPELVEGWEPNPGDVDSGSELEDNNFDDTGLAENSDSNDDEDEKVEVESSDNDVYNFSF